MTRNKAGDETNRALVAYVRNLSDEKLADLLVSLDPKVYQDLLERALGQQPSKRPPRISHELGTLLIATPAGKGRAGQGEYVQSGCLSAYARS
jgi:hypothetical protein